MKSGVIRDSNNSCHPKIREDIILIRYFIHLFIIGAFVIMLIGCNSSKIPTNPPTASKGGQPPEGPVIPNPPNPPSEPVPGDNYSLSVAVFLDTNSGKIPLAVEFDSEVEGGLEPFKYFWDFDSNGVIDSVDPDPSCVYASPGIYIAKITVEDSAGAQAIEEIEIEARFPTPNARPSAIPMTGAAPLDVNFIAEDSSSQAGASIVEYRWDFQPDGIWDYVSTSSGNTTFTYDDAGNYYPVLRVKDNLGFWEEASLHIIVTF